MALDDLESYLAPFSRIICEISKTSNEQEIIDSIDTYFNKFPIKETNYGHEGRVWILIGQRGNEKYRSLMVAQAENIYDEILKDVQRMFNHQYQENDDGTWETRIKFDLDIFKNPKQVVEKEDAFLYQSDSKQGKISYFYRYLKKKYNVLKFYEVKIDQYLGSCEINDGIGREMYEISKDYYCESMLAIKTSCENWAPYGSGVGKRFYYSFLEN